MEIKGKVHCFFEQSGTFKNEFIKLGIPAEDYDIQNNFGQTDFQIDLFAEIDKAYVGDISIFDSFSKDDLIMAFFPCIHFNDAKTLFFKCESICQRNMTLSQKMRYNIDLAKEREFFLIKLFMLCGICDKFGLRLIIENPWNVSGETYLQHNFMRPTIIDKNRMLRGDYFVKPTAYWFIGCTNTIGYSYQKDKKQRIINKMHNQRCKGVCSEERSMISPDYARNFICDFIIGKSQPDICPTLFD